MPVVGGKCASLGELIKAGIPVPPGFAITTAAYLRFLEEGGIREDILKLVGEVRSEDTSSGEEASRRIRELIENTPIGIELEDYIGEFYRRLSSSCQVPAVPAAVRSSATAEDLPGASFAGQQDTFLWIRGIDDILTQVRKCWSSLFTPRAIAYRVNAGHGGVVIFPGLLGHALDPSTPLNERDVNQLGAGIWNRVLIDATRNWTFERQPEWNNERFPPTVAPAPDDEALGLKRWKEYGFE